MDSERRPMNQEASEHATPAGWRTCSSCGTLVAERHLAAMVFAHCPSCGSRNLTTATEHQSRLADAGAVRIKTYSSGRGTSPTV